MLLSVSRNHLLHKPRTAPLQCTDLGPDRFQTTRLQLRTACLICEYMGLSMFYSLYSYSLVMYCGVTGNNVRRAVKQ